MYLSRRLDLHLFSYLRACRTIVVDSAAHYLALSPIIGRSAAGVEPRELVREQALVQLELLQAHRM